MQRENESRIGIGIWEVNRLPWDHFVQKFTDLKVYGQNSIDLNYLGLEFKVDYWYVFR
jgi:hypothetical protein